MILDTLWKILFSKKQFGFLTTLADPPPGLAKDHTFSQFFFETFPNFQLCHSWEIWWDYHNDDNDYDYDDD